MNILSNFYTTDIVNDQRYKFSPSGVYYAPPKGSYEDYVEFIKELPMTQNPEIFGMHDNVDISRELQETRQVERKNLKNFHFDSQCMCIHVCINSSTLFFYSCLIQCC